MRTSNLRKIRILLDALEAAGKSVEYYALDVSLEELQRTLSEIPPGTFSHVKCFGLHGTYDDGLEWLKTPGNACRPKAILSLGSSVGNFSRDEGAQFLRIFATALQPGDSIIIGIDACKDPEKVFHAYNDRQGVTHRFILNGLRHANRLLRQTAFDLDKWRVIGAYDEANGRHHAFVLPSEDIKIDDVLVRANEKIFFEQSFKYDELDRCRLWQSAGVVEGAEWSIADYGQ